MRHSSTNTMENPVDKSLGEVTVPYVFTFVPVVHKLPIESCLEETSAASGGKQHENVAEETTREAMSGEQPFRFVYIPNSEHREEKHSTQSHRNTETACEPPQDFVSGSAPSFSDQSQNTSSGGQATMEAAANRHTDIYQQPYQCVPGRESEVSCYFKTQQDRASPTISADLFPTPASSRESILSACSEKDAFPISDSHTISPCSSVYSGIFTPSILTVKKHFLAPGSSLISLPQSLRSSCESLSCPMSPTQTRHRPPLTRLSLLTAILRKGRLPVLSSSVQRPYTPCWPINNITVSHCNACSAASSVASIPLAFSTEFSSTTSIDSQSDAYRDPTRCATAPPLLCKTSCPKNQIKTSLSNTVPRWQQVISPPAPSSLKSQQKDSLIKPVPVGSSIVKSVSPVNRSYVSISKPQSPILKPSICINVDNSPNKLTCVSPEPALELNTGVPQKWTRLPNSSFSKLQSLSQQLKSPPSCSSENVTSTYSSSPPPTGFTAEKLRVPTQFEQKNSPFLSHCLSPSRYTPMAFSGWPSPGASPSPTPTHTPTPSPAPPIRDFTPSPCLSLRSTPSPRPGSGISDSSDKEGKKRKPHKIKSSYKSLAAIPTNTLLLDQQVIDEQVERGEASSGDRGVPLDAQETDTHKEMCSPAWLKKESEELYAVIDEILRSSPIPPKSKSPVVKEAQKNNSTFPRMYGRETKYASVGSLKPSGNDQRRADLHKTRPGLIRTMATAPRLTAEDPHRQSECSPSRHFVSPLHFSTKGRNTSGVDSSSEGKTLGADVCPLVSSACDLHITEPEELRRLPLKHGPSSSFCPTERKPEAFQTQI